MATFRQHIPSFCEGFEPETAEVRNAEELLALPVVERYRTNDPSRRFHRFSVSHQRRGPSLLMVEHDEGHYWWVVGYLDDTTGIDLPEWSPPADFRTNQGA